MGADYETWLLLHQRNAQHQWIPLQDTRASCPRVKYNKYLIYNKSALEIVTVQSNGTKKKD